MDRSVTFTNAEGKQLAGILHLPPETPAPGVVLCHGFLSNKERYQDLAVALQRRGFAVLRFDFSGIGESEGKQEDITVTEEIGDLGKALDFLAHQPGVIADRLGVYGSSLGGLVSLIAGCRDARIKVLAVRAPVSDFGSLHLKKMKGEGTVSLNLNSVTYVNNNAGLRFRIKYRFYFDGRKYNAQQEARKIACPVLIIHGDKDDIVPLEQSQQLVKRLSKGELVVLKNATHSFTPEEKTATWARVGDWFEQWL